MSLKIKITGEAGEGKSTLGILISNLLTAHGLIAEVEDYDDNVNDISIETVAARVNTIRERQPLIRIKIRQSKKTKQRKH